MRKAPFSKNFSSLDRRRVGRAVRPVDSLLASGIESLERERSIHSPENIAKHDTNHIIPRKLLANEPQKKTNPEEYSIKIRIKAVYHDGKSLKDNDALLFRVSSDNSKVFVTHSGRVVDHTVFSRHDIKGITFGTSHKSILIEINELSYVLIKHLNNDAFLHDYFAGTALWKFKGRITDEKLIDTMELLDSKRRNPTKSSDSISTPEPKKTTNEVYSPPTPLQNHSVPLRRSTRERRAPSELKLYVLDVPEETVTPAKFTPPLNYKFHDNKIFTVSQSDFRTLYNNDWINDTLIDFFIKYDIDKAIYEHKKFTPDQIYAFNSFFFTKLTSSDDHYANVKRWLNKINLTLFPYIIIPINENLHWYGCIIRGLPELLERKKNEIDLTSDNETSEPSQEPSQDTHSESTEGPPKNGAPGRKRAEVFIFDSLSQRHYNIHAPLKQFIIEYCKENHDVHIRKDEIRIQHARVPRQNNFNDCGIHVIYNIKKWLAHSAEIEKVWRNYQRAAYRSYFVAEERNKMRQELIDLLLKLHNELVHVELAHESDDEIEVIEELLRSTSQEETVKPETEPAPGNSETAISKKAVSERAHLETAKPEPVERVPELTDTAKDRVISDIVSSFAKKDDDAKEQTTLDPRRIKNPFINSQVRSIFAGLVVSPVITDTINKLFPEVHEAIPERDIVHLKQLAKNLTAVTSGSEEAIADAISKWEVQISKYPSQRRPKDESFVIRDENEDRLNQSVHELSIKAGSDDLLSEVLFLTETSVLPKDEDLTRAGPKRRRLNS